MRIVTWNMGCGPRSKYRRTHADAWRLLLEQLQPDVALVQEAMLSCDDFVRPFGSIIWSRDRTRDSGTAVVVRSGIDFASREVSVPGSFVAIASLSVGGVQTEVVSVHVGPPDYRKNLVELRSWLVRELLPRGSCVIGGDLNSSRSIASWHLEYLTELPTVGLHDCHWSLHGREVQSFWGHQAKSAYQDDHIFTSTGLAKAVRSCQVHDTPDIRVLSDHGPVTLDLELTAG